MIHSRTSRGLCLFASLAIGGVATRGHADTYSYHIGNSLTEDLQPLGVEALAALRGRQHDVGYHIAYAHNLNSIWTKPTFTNVMPVPEYGMFTKALTEHRWDAVTLQPWRNESATLGEDTARVLDFINLARSNPENSDTEFFLYTGWPQLNVFSAWTRSVVNDNATRSVTARDYFPLLAERVRASTDASVFIVPVGEVFFQLEWKIKAGELPGINQLSDLYRDWLHASSVGRYVAGVTTYATLFREDPAGLTAPAGFYGASNSLYTPELYVEIHETVWDVVREHSLQYSGDFDGNGLVEQGDLDLVLTHWGKSSEAVPQEWLFHRPNGRVDQDELDQVLINWGGPGTVLGVGAVPEPGSQAILVCILFCFSGWLVRSRPAGVFTR